MTMFGIWSVIEREMVLEFMVCIVLYCKGWDVRVDGATLLRTGDLQWEGSRCV